MCWGLGFEGLGCLRIEFGFRLGPGHTGDGQQIDLVICTVVR